MTTAERIHEALHWPYDLDNDYSTDYLLERLPKGTNVVKEQLTDLYNAGVPRIYRSAAPTPRQALQNLTVALIEAGVLGKENNE